jgi:hypothetical protein
VAATTITDQAVKEALIGLLSQAGQALQIHLYTNNVAPDRTNTAPGQFVEAAYPGYAPVAWVYTPVTLDAAHQGQLAAAVPVFPPPTSGADVAVYGWFVTYLSLETDSLIVLMAAQFSAPPRTLTVGGPSLGFNLSLSSVDASP